MMIIIKVVISGLLAMLGTVCLDQGSSAAFELGIGLWFFAVFHWLFWRK